MAASEAQNGGATFNHTGPALVASRQMLDRFQVRTCTGRPDPLDPPRRSTSSAHRNPRPGRRGRPTGGGAAGRRARRRREQRLGRARRPSGGPRPPPGTSRAPPCGPAAPNRASAARRRRGRTPRAWPTRRQSRPATTGSRPGPREAPIGVPSGVTSSSDARRGGGSGSGLDIAAHHRARGPSRTRHNARNTSEGA